MATAGARPTEAHRVHRLTKLAVRGVLIGFCIAVLFSNVPTLLDWYANPAGIFHGDSGTHWDVVLETHLSWLWPLFSFFAPVSIAVLFWLDRRSKRHSA